MAPYRTAPDASDRMPGGVPYIIGNEAAERFSFYGMKAILFVFMTEYLRNRLGAEAPMKKEEATFWIHIFNGAVYFTPVIGAILSDAVLGKYRTIIALSIVYCLGHLTLALDDSRFGLALGLGLIALGAGGIKPCVSAHVGDQFGSRNGHLVSKIFGWFYLSINVGAFISSLATPELLKGAGPEWAFGVPGILMGVATLVFWMGRHRFVHIPPAREAYFREVFTVENLKSFGHLSLIYFVFIAAFWALFDQNASTWVDQAQKMDRRIFGYEFEASQFQALNPFFILVLVPLFNYGLYPLLNRFFTLTDLRKIGIGLFLAVPSFLIPTWLETQIVGGATPTIWWQVLAYLFQTASEVMVSITALEFAYTQARPKMKSLVMVFYLWSVMVGNWFAALVVWLVMGEDSVFNLTGPEFFRFFTYLMLAVAILFIPVARLYKPVHYLQSEAVSDEEAEAEIR